MAINSLDSNKNKRNNKNTSLTRFLVKRRKNYPRFFKVVYPSIRWFLVMEQSMWAFFASYFVLIIIFFIPLLIFIWVYFPLIALKHGENIGTKRFDLYQQDLCAKKNDYWIKCVKLSTDHLMREELPETVYGRVIVKNGSLVGLITSDGPVTMTMPLLFFQKTKKNECYQAECK